MNSTRQYNDKENKARRWSNCFGLSKKMKRIKNRLSFSHNNDIQKNNNNNNTTKDNVLHSTTTLPLKTPTSTIHHVSIYSYYKDETFEEQEEDEHENEREKDKHEKDKINHHQPIEQINHSKQQHININKEEGVDEEDEDDQDVIKSYFERLSLQDKVQRSSSALSPPPRHNIKPNRGRAFSDTTPLNDNSMYDWRQFTTDYKKMTLRLSIDTTGFKHLPSVIKSSSPPSSTSTSTSTNTTTNDKNKNNYNNDSPIEIAPVRDSMLIYQQDPSSFLLHHPNTSNISQNSSMIPQPPPPPFRTGTLGQPKPTISSSLSTTSTITTSLLTVPAPASAPAPSPSITTTTITTSQSPLTSNITFQLQKKKNKLTIDEEQEDIEQDDTLSRCSSSSDIPLKERRRRRSPLMFTHNDKLVLPLPKNDIYSSSSSPPPPPLSSSALNREKTMQQLEGNKERKTIIIPRIASTKSLDKQMALNDHILNHSPSSSPKYNNNHNNHNDTTLMNKAHYDAVVSRTSLNRRPSSTLSSISPSSPFPPPSTSTTIPLLTPNTGKTLNSLHLLSSSSTTTTTSPPPPPPLSSSYNTTTSSKYLLPTPTTQQYQSSLYFPTTPNSMDLSY
ncbi:unnamed protein product [Cunninghamella echinulata]